MAAFRDISNIIDQAIQNQTDVWIRYRNMQSSFSEEIVSPFEWIDEDKTLFQAHCYLRSEDALFNVFTILQAQIHESAIPPETSQPQAQSELEQVRSAALIARPVSRMGSEEDEDDTQPPEPIQKIENPTEWRRLMLYYRDCLLHERLAQMSLPKQDLFLIGLERQQILEFFQQKVDLQFTLNFRYLVQSLRNFLDPERHPQEILCLGTCFYCLDGTLLAPLLFSPVRADFQTENLVQIQAGECGISTAPLIKLGLNHEEISQFLNETNLYLQVHTTQIEDVEGFLRSKLSALYSTPVQSSPVTTVSLDDLPQHAIFNGTGLFWLKLSQEGSASEELAELSKENYWNSAPDVLLSLLNPKQTSDTQPILPALKNSFTLRSLNKQQHSAAAMALKKKMTVVSGPPGSGKSEVLLNTLLQAFLDGKTVLFTSASKAATNDLYNQLVNRLAFAGVVRAGLAYQTPQAAQRLDQLIKQIHKERLKEYKEQVASNWKHLTRVEEQLEKIQDLRGKEISYQNELEEIERLLPKPIVRKVLELTLPYDDNEKQLFLEALSRSSDQVRALVNARLELQQQVEFAIVDRENRHTATKVIKEFEDQWGAFGGDELSSKNIARLEDIIDLIRLWLDLLTMLEAKRAQDLAQARLHDLEHKANRSLQKLSEDYRQRAIQISRLFRKADLINTHKSVGEIKNEFDKHAANPRGWSEKITSRLKLLDPHASTTQRLSAIMLQFGWPDLAGALSNSSLAERVELSNDLTAIFRAAILLQKAQECRELFEMAQAKAVALSEPLPPRIRKDISKLNLTAFDAQSLNDALIEIQKKADAVLLQRKNATESVSQLIVQNNLRLHFIQRLQEIFTGPERAFFKLNEEAAENQLDQYLRIWRRIAWLWELHNIILNIADQKPGLPNEAQALLDLQTATAKYQSSVRDLLHATWIDRAAALDDMVLQGATRYVYALQEETQFIDNNAENEFSQISSALKENFTQILRVFPIWVADSASIAESFPLTSELFDLVIVDQATLVNIPLGISLLYRAKSLLIAGDPLPQSYLPLLTTTADQILAKKHSVALPVFSYSNHSLFNLAENSSQSVIHLTDHYRSDPRIATFISKEFYDRPLRICTNLVKKGYSREQVNQIGGIAWVNIKGAFQRHESGSAVNLSEQEHVQELVNRLAVLYHKQPDFQPSIAILSPFRTQAARLRSWVEKALPTDFSIRVGTPQEFHGQEFDIIVFSPVVSSGMPKEALEGIEVSANLLNLAISRAKMSVIIVGDWNFCYSQLPTNHSFHHLARYAKEKCKSVVDSLTNLAILKGQVSCALGHFSDPADTEHSRTTLEQLLLSCRDRVLWVDAQLDQQALDLLDEVLDRAQDQRIRDIHLLTTEKQVFPSTGKPALRMDVLFNFQKYLANLGTQFEVRTIPAAPATSRGLLVDSTGGILLPQFHTVFRKHRLTSEYSVARAPDGFDELWNRATPVEQLAISKKA